MSGPDLGSGPSNAPDPAPPPAPPTDRPAGTAGATASAAGAAAGEAASAAARAMEGMFRSFSMSEQLIVAGALLVLIVGEFLFGALLGGGGAFVAVVIASAELLLAVWLKNRRNVVWPASYGLILSALVVTVAVMELDDLLFWIHQLTQPGGAGSASEILSRLSGWAGAVLMTWGVITYWRGGGE